MNIAIGADEAAFELKEKIITHLSNMGHEVKDYGVYDANPILYPDIALRVATAVVSGKYERGLNETPWR
jgi:ribose 5-phosphate isomerase B